MSGEEREAYRTQVLERHEGECVWESVVCVLHLCVCLVLIISHGRISHCCCYAGLPIKFFCFEAGGSFAKKMGMTQCVGVESCLRLGQLL